MSQESVWKYPRPPKVEPTTKRIRVEFAGELVADTLHAVRVLETSHPPCTASPGQTYGRTCSYLAHVAAFVSSRVWLLTGRCVWATSSQRRPLGAMSPLRPITTRSAVISPSMRAGWTPVTSVKSACKLSQESSTAAGSPLISSGRLRVDRDLKHGDEYSSQGRPGGRLLRMVRSGAIHC